MINRDKIIELIENNTKDSDLFMVDVIVKQPNIFTVIMDGDNGIRIQDCVSISRLIESNFDRDIDDYKLDVSSSGLDKPLKLKRQYNKFIGKQLMIVDVEGNENSGTLIEINETELKLELNINQKKSKKLPVKNSEKFKVLEFNKIKEAKAIITF